MLRVSYLPRQCANGLDGGSGASARKLRTSSGSQARLAQTLTGWTASAAKHLSHRLFSRKAIAANGGMGSDLVQYYLRETVGHLNPLAVSLYLTTALNRKDISDV
eukprot:scaffold632313_cov51-Prasinocladus_malaysianus.AAC.1